MTARNPLKEEGLYMDVAELVALAVALSLPLLLVVEEVVHRLLAWPKQVARVEMRRTARKLAPGAQQRLPA